MIEIEEILSKTAGLPGRVIFNKIPRHYEAADLWIYVMSSKKRVKILYLQLDQLVGEALKNIKHFMHTHSHISCLTSCPFNFNLSIHVCI